MSSIQQYVAETLCLLEVYIPMQSLTSCFTLGARLGLAWLSAFEVVLQHREEVLFKNRKKSKAIIAMGYCENEAIGFLNEYPTLDYETS